MSSLINKYHKDTNVDIDTDDLLEEECNTDSRQVYLEVQLLDLNIIYNSLEDLEASRFWETSILHDYVVVRTAVFVLFAMETGGHNCGIL